jgi:phage tail-like protein
MNINGSRFHMLLGEADWQQCQTNDGLPPNWDDLRKVTTLPYSGEKISQTPGEPLFTLSDRRGAVADHFGNLYWVSADRYQIHVTNAGLKIHGSFWPDGRNDGDSANSLFQPASPSPKTAAMQFDRLAITSDNYLIASGKRDGAAWLARFDLIAGGGPALFQLPADRDFDIIDIAPTSSGELWLLDGKTKRLFRLDRDLLLVKDSPDTEIATIFTPHTGPAKTELHSEPALGLQMPIATALPIGLAVLATGDLAVLATRAQKSYVFLLEKSSNSIRRLVEFDHAFLQIAAHAADHMLYLTDNIGNQILQIVLQGAGAALTGKIDKSIIPMRRFGGRALCLRGQYIVYDSGKDNPLWVPALPQPMQRYETQHSFVTPIFDGREAQVIWDRIRLDACIPNGTGIVIEARAADLEIALKKMGLNQGWRPQPRPYLNHDKGELPGKSSNAIVATSIQQQTGVWDLLLQSIVGRYAQFRITMTGDARQTPHLRSLRAWYPRFSYVDQFLPAVYREDQDSGDFLDRFLANMEGVNSVIEGKIASAQTLFDVRTATPDMLNWLASWFDVALDPSWNDRQRRLFVKHAATFFGWRGTIRGLKLALKLAVQDSIAEADFDLSGPEKNDPSGVRIIESYLTRNGIGTMANSAHRFTVLLPRLRADQTPEQEAEMKRLAERIIAIEKPAHTIFDVRFHWTMNRIGEARLGSDTHLGQSSRAAELIPAAILGRSFIGASVAGGPNDNPEKRERLAC